MQPILAHTFPLWYLLGAGAAVVAFGYGLPSVGIWLGWRRRRVPAAIVSVLCCAFSMSALPVMQDGPGQQLGWWIALGVAPLALSLASAVLCVRSYFILRAE